MPLHFPPPVAAVPGLSLTSTLVRAAPPPTWYFSLVATPRHSSRTLQSGTAPPPGLAPAHTAPAGLSVVRRADGSQPPGFPHRCTMQAWPVRSATTAYLPVPAPYSMRRHDAIAYHHTYVRPLPYRLEGNVYGYWLTFAHTCAFAIPPDVGGRRHSRRAGTLRRRLRGLSPLTRTLPGGALRLHAFSPPMPFPDMRHCLTFPRTLWRVT